MGVFVYYVFYIKYFCCQFMQNKVDDIFISVLNSRHCNIYERTNITWYYIWTNCKMNIMLYVIFIHIWSMSLSVQVWWSWWLSHPFNIWSKSCWFDTYTQDEPKFLKRIKWKCIGSVPKNFVIFYEAYHIQMGDC